jgi:hypothetical protein
MACGNGDYTLNEGRSMKFSERMFFYDAAEENVSSRSTEFARKNLGGSAEWQERN